jgi:hypothetical protein
VPNPITDSVKPSCRFGFASTFVVHGKHFGAALSYVTVDLSSADGYTWNPKSMSVQLTGADCVRVTSTPSDNGHRGPGLGDLTITVTVSGNPSPPLKQIVHYGP